MNFKVGSAQWNTQMGGKLDGGWIGPSGVHVAARLRAMPEPAMGHSRVGSTPCGYKQTQNVTSYIQVSWDLTSSKGTSSAMAHARLIGRDWLSSGQNAQLASSARESTRETSGERQNTV
uniref:Uncharacterized protein n=1 Tax=Heterorhabditis bacteriophora TaxID=37862 RepID=A0A1I7W888_HETBA